MVEISYLCRKQNVYVMIIKSILKITLASALVLGVPLMSHANAAIETNLFRTLTNGKVQVLRMSYDGTGINYWIVSTRWYERDYYTGKVFYYRLKSDEEIELEKKAIDKKEVGQFVIFIFENNNVVLDYLDYKCDYCV